MASHNKRKPGQIEADKVFISDLYAKGRTHQEITEALNSVRPYSLSRPIISGQIQDILEEWRNRSAIDIAQKVAEELLRLNWIERQASDSWEKSKAEATKTISENSEGKNGRSLERVIRDGRDGDPRFLMIIGNCVTERCKLLGLYAAAKAHLGDIEGKPFLIPTAAAPTTVIVNVRRSEQSDAEVELYGDRKPPAGA